jgi:GMP synthase-like glutamine amidotransferase
MIKTYVVGWGALAANWIPDVRLVRRMEDSDLVLFTGGEDINPAIYGAEPHPSVSHWSPHRDAHECEAFVRATRLGKPMVGICRGAQLFCALMGGKLVQHQRHPSIHMIDTFDGKKITVTSAHHQRQFPFLLPANEYRILGWCDLSPFSWGEDGEDLICLGGKRLPEVEIAFYPRLRALGIQSHPEWAYPCTHRWEERYVEYCQRLVVKLLSNAL